MKIIYNDDDSDTRIFTNYTRNRAIVGGEERKFIVRVLNGALKNVVAITTYPLG